MFASSAARASSKVPENCDSYRNPHLSKNDCGYLVFGFFVVPYFQTSPGFNHTPPCGSLNPRFITGQNLPLVAFSAYCSTTCAVLVVVSQSLPAFVSGPPTNSVPASTAFPTSSSSAASPPKP